MWRGHLAPPSFTSERRTILCQASTKPDRQMPLRQRFPGWVARRCFIRRCSQCCATNVARDGLGLGLARLTPPRAAPPAPNCIAFLVSESGAWSDWRNAVSDAALIASQLAEV